jgi:hypothetical protein
MAETLTPTLALTPTVAPGEFTATDKFIFECWGYLVIPDVLTADEAAECYDASARLHAQRDREFGQLGRGYEVEPSLERLIDHPGCPRYAGFMEIASSCRRVGTLCSPHTQEWAGGIKTDRVPTTSSSWATPCRWSS